MIGHVKMKEVVLAVVNAVDILNPILKHHHRRTAVLAYHIGTAYGYREGRLTNLVVAAALHDIGALTVEDQSALRRIDVLDPGPHERLGALMLSSFDPFCRVSQIIENHHVNYSKSIDMPYIPDEAYVLHLADRIEILLNPKEIASNQSMSIEETILPYSGNLFKPGVVQAYIAASAKGLFWSEVDSLSIKALFERIDLQCIDVHADADLDDKDLESLVYTLSRVVDYKSKFTVAHSARVAYVAEKLAEGLGLVREERAKVKLAGYLHDYGKIAVPAKILSKQGELTKAELRIMRLYPYYTSQILSHVEGLGELAEWTSHHYVRADAVEFSHRPNAEFLELETEILIYSDLFAAMLEERPYRKPLSSEEAIRLIEEEFVPQIGIRPLAVLKAHATEIQEEIDKIREELLAGYDWAVVRNIEY